MRIVLLTLAMVVGVVTAAWASCTSRHWIDGCRYEWDASLRFPQQAKRYGRGSFVYVCMENVEQTKLFFGSPVKRSKEGVCSFWRQDMKPADGQDSASDRRSYMQLTKGKCPLQDDSGYISSTVSARDFADLMSGWDATALSGGLGLVFPPQTEGQRRFGEVDFAKTLRTPAGHRRLVVQGIDAASAIPPDAFPQYHGPHDFDMSVHDYEHPSMLYAVAVSRQGARLRVVHVDSFFLGC